MLALLPPEQMRPAASAAVVLARCSMQLSSSIQVAAGPADSGVQLSAVPHRALAAAVAALAAALAASVAAVAPALPVPMAAVHAGLALAAHAVLGCPFLPEQMQLQAAG
jgi:hypothetical protein